MSIQVLEIGAAVLAQAGAPPVHEVPESVQVQSVWDFVQKGGLMMIPIGICSLIALTVIVERLISLRRSKVIPATFRPGLLRLLQADPDDTARALAYCRKDGSPVANVFAAGIKKLDCPSEVVEKHIQEAGEREVLKLRKYLRSLSVIASVAPLLGLLGTIFGMITAFQTVAISAEALGKTELLAEGIYAAMITTAAGLSVAIPVLVCYHWLSARIDRLVMDIDGMSVDFVEEYAAEEKRDEGTEARKDRAPDASTPPSLATHSLSPSVS